MKLDGLVIYGNVINILCNNKWEKALYLLCYVYSHNL